MWSRWILLVWLLVPFLGGCYTTEVRHLASDACLIQAGVSTRKDVLRYLGEPSGRRFVSRDVEEWVYYEDQANTLTHVPIVDRLLGPKGYEMLMVTLHGDRVAGVEYRVFHKDDRNWRDDFTWKEVR